MEIDIIKNYKDELFLIGYESGNTYLGIDLQKLLYDKKSYLIEMNNDEIEFYYDSILTNEVDCMFNEKITKYIKLVFKKRKEILERAKMYNKEQEFKEIIDELEKQFGVLKG